MDEKIRKQFEELTCRLSPENLHCDGEISRSQAMRKLAQIRREWKALEKQVGRKVSEDEIENELYARMRSK